jgi:deoxyribose-phosphate aldolase
MKENMSLPTVQEVAKTIDHALLKPAMTRSEVTDGLALAAEYDVYSVCVRPSDVLYAVEELTGTDVKVGTVIGFPHGVTHTNTKLAEIKQAITDGAKEVDIVLNIGWVKSGMFGEVENELGILTAAAYGGRIEQVKVILETAYLTENEIAAASKAVEASGAHFVKTSTGFAGAGATLENLKIMKASTSNKVELKASGGVTNLDTLLEMRELGVTRFGTSATQVILDDLASRLATGSPDAKKYTESY